MSEDKFEFSSHPNYLEWYKCYNDLSNTDWDDGSELRDHKDAWDERAITKWNFFYPPFRPVVGRPQKKMINERRAAIRASNNEIENAKREIAGQKEKIRQAINVLLMWSGLWVLAILWLLSTDFWQAFVIPLGAAGITLWKFEEKRRAAQAEIQRAEGQVNQQSGVVRQNEREIELLEGEIRHLLGQVPESVKAVNIERWLAEEIAQMELACLGDFLSKMITLDNIAEHIQHDFGDPRVKGLLVDSWGFLQPVSQKGPMGIESTGLGKAWDDLESHVATWQIGSNGIPVFRVLFLQYIFPLERNLNICSFFYDFVTRRTYGKRFETFQYNHVTNYSIRDLDLQGKEWIHEAGLTTMTGLLKGKSLQALTITVAGGNHFRCVMGDEDVAEALNKFLKQDEKYRVLEAILLNDQELREKFQDNKELIAKWKEAEKARIEAEMKEVVQEKQRILWNSSRTAQTIYAHLRNCIEGYSVQFQQSV